MPAQMVVESSSELLSTTGAAAQPRSAAAPADASFSSRWYVVGLSEQLGTDKPFATRLWGEPLVLFRDPAGEAVCVRDVCPHRSAPLSMGDVSQGTLTCFYHGWSFGAGGKCVNVPTIPAERRPNLEAMCADAYAVAEREGALWVWRGNPLTADARTLPAAEPAAARGTLAVDTVLDYECDWSLVVSARLEAPLLSASTDLVALAPAGVNPLEARLDGPNVVRLLGGEGYSEELHAVPVAPRRCRVILRQRFPQTTPLARLLTALPGGAALLRRLVRGWNGQAALEGYDALLRRAEAPQGGLAAELRDWVARAEERDGAAPYFVGWDASRGTSMDVSTGAAAASQPPAPLLARHGPQEDDDAETGTYGLKRNYIQAHPALEFAPARAGDSGGLFGLVDPLQALLAGAVAVPAAMLTHDTIGPAVALMIEKH